MSRRKDALSWGLIALVLLLVGAATVYILWPQLQPHTTLHLGDGVYTARVAKTQADREKGLSGTSSLGEDQAMILAYDTDGKWPVSMKGIKYSIDIIWLDKDKKVIYIVKNARPESYPYETYAPKDDARYVVEVVAGTTGRKAITINDAAEFDLNNIEGLQL
ncbi:MAG TPA: DUF192 domain-containing protein [Verrucomicrobiae bacterium]|nr:DUF192 domain-containing protein [Verrucomicrobiae bacterium]